MPNQNQRPSLTITLDKRYSQQRAGGAFDVKEILGPPGQSPSSGDVIDAASQQGANVQNPNGFWVKPVLQVSQFKVVQNGGLENNYSLYIRGLDTTKYRP